MYCYLEENVFCFVEEISEYRLSHLLTIYFHVLHLFFFTKGFSSFSTMCSMFFWFSCLNLLIIYFHSFATLKYYSTGICSLFFFSSVCASRQSCLCSPIFEWWSIEHHSKGNGSQGRPIVSLIFHIHTHSHLTHIHVVFCILYRSSANVSSAFGEFSISRITRRCSGCQPLRSLI